MMKNMGQLMKQAQQMQGKLAKIQDELATMTVAGHAGGGMVEVQLNGKQELQKVKIDPAAVDVSDLSMLEDLIVAAYNDAHRKIQEITQQEMAKLTGGLNIPGLNLPF